MAGTLSGYYMACNKARLEPITEFVDAVGTGQRECNLASRPRPLTDADIACIAVGLSGPHSIRCLSLEENAFGMDGIGHILEVLESNPNRVRELRLGRNKLKDPCVIAIAHELATNGMGIKILDLSENGITNIGLGAIVKAINSAASDLVEVSFHNNDLDKDAAAALQSIVNGHAKLKHLHLGYNQLKDAGATQLARCLHAAQTLTTLDLTANQIGPQGGQELARALLGGRCPLQRLNLRHNTFDDDTLLKFSEVISRNTVLTQLSLGYMHPSPRTANTVLLALKGNKSLLLLDIYGWALDLTLSSQIIEDIMFHNTTVRAITTDACQPIFHAIDKHNLERQEKGLHDIYIGPDDRHSAIAAEGGVLTQVSRTSSVAPNPSPRRITSEANSVTTHLSTTSVVQRVNKREELHRAQSALSGIEGNDTTSRSGPPASHSALTRHHNPSNTPMPVAAPRNISYGAASNQSVDELNSHLLLVLSQLEMKMSTADSFHRQSITNLELRVKALEDQMVRCNQREHAQDTRISELASVVQLLQASQEGSAKRIAELEHALKAAASNMASANTVNAKATAMLQQTIERVEERSKNGRISSASAIAEVNIGSATLRPSDLGTRSARPTAPSRGTVAADAPGASRSLFGSAPHVDASPAAPEAVSHNQSGLNNDAPVLKAPAANLQQTTQARTSPPPKKSHSVSSNTSVASPNPRPVATTFVIPASSHSNLLSTTVPVRAGQLTPNRGPGTHRPSSDFRNPQQDADQYYGNPTGRRPSVSPPRLTTEPQLELPELVVRDEKVDRCFQPNEPSPIHEDSMPAPDLQTSFQPPATAAQIGSAKASARPNDLPRRKTAPMLTSGLAETFDV